MDLSLMVPALAMVGALLVGAVVVAVFRRWQKSDKPLAPNPSDQLAQFRALYEPGTISEEEFRRLRTVLAGEIREANNLPPPPAAAGAGPAEAAAPKPNGQALPGTNEPPQTDIRPA